MACAAALVTVQERIKRSTLAWQPLSKEEKSETRVSGKVLPGQLAPCLESKDEREANNTADIYRDVFNHGGGLYMGTFLTLVPLNQ